MVQIGEFTMDLELLIAIIVALIGWIIAIVKIRIAKKNKISTTIFEKRLSIYNEYFTKLDSINENITIDAEEYLQPVLNDLYDGIISNPESAGEHLIKLSKEMNEFTRKAGKSMNQAHSELNTLRFISTEKTREILNEYRTLSKMQLDALNDLYKTINLFDKDNLINPDANSKLKEIGKELELIRDKLEIQMRKDLGV